MGYFREHVASVETYVPGYQPRSHQGIIKLNANENPFPPSLRIEEALGVSLIDELRWYPDAVSRELRRTAASLWGVSLDNVFVGNGGDEVLRLAYQLTLDPGEPVVYPYPTYVLYRTLAEIAAARPVEIDLTEDFQIPEGFESNIGRLTILCSPNNPTGNTFRLSDIRRVLDAARGRGLVVVDEAYAAFSNQNLVPLIREYDNLLVLRSLSKSHSLAGLRIGFGIGDSEIVGNLLKVKDSYNVNLVSQRIAGIALNDAAHVEANIDRIRISRTKLVAQLDHLGFRVHPSEANFLLVRHPRRPAAEIQHALREKGILVRHFSERRLENSLRISIGRDDENQALIEALPEILTL